MRDDLQGSGGDDGDGLLVDALAVGVAWRQVADAPLEAERGDDDGRAREASSQFDLE